MNRLLLGRLSSLQRMISRTCVKLILIMRYNCFWTVFEPATVFDVVRARVRADGLTVSSYTFAFQALLRVLMIGIPIVDACEVCSRNVVSDAPRIDRNPLSIHACSHSELLNNHIYKYKPIAR